MTPDSTRRQLVFPDDLYSECVKAAAREQAATGKTVSVAEWIREACRQRLSTEPAP